MRARQQALSPQRTSTDFEHSYPLKATFLRPHQHAYLPEFGICGPNTAISGWELASSSEWTRHLGVSKENRVFPQRGGLLKAPLKIEQTVKNSLTLVFHQPARLEFGGFVAGLGVSGAPKSRSDDDAIPKAYRGGGATQRSAILALPEGPGQFFAASGPQ